MTKFLISWLDAMRAALTPGQPDIPGEAKYKFWRAGRDWHYALVSGNNEALSASTQGYASKGAVLRAISQHRRNAATDAEVETDRAPKE